VLNVERAGLGRRLRFYEAPSHDALPRLLAEDERFDFAFVDGMHLFDYAMVDFFYIDRMLSVGGVIAFDDIWMRAIRKVVSFVLKNRSYELVKITLRKQSRLISAATSVKRILQDPLGKDLAVKLVPGNVCVLRKLADDGRLWDYHRSF
jgi:predicted O-methyltransferase YrrM